MGGLSARRRAHSTHGMGLAWQQYDDGECGASQNPPQRWTNGFIMY